MGGGFQTQRDTERVFRFNTLITAGSWALRIGQLHVPSPIRNGSVKDVILDCDYSLDPGEKSEGLVVKWFLNQETNPLPVYQWIANKIPQDLGVLRNRVDLMYHATDQPSTRHRALRILNPTIELSGEYRCEVSSFYGEDSKTKKMIIYVPEENLELTQSKTTVEGQVRLSCEADGVFPKPEMTFIKRSIEYGGGKIMDGAEVRVTDRKDGLFDIEADIVVDEASLDEGAQYAFGCELSIPDANYTLIEWENYEATRIAPRMKNELVAAPCLLFFSNAVLWLCLRDGDNKITILPKKNALFSHCVI
ncbi:hypothetical protein FOCC_FOCC001216 [Frankliniella occidentalis]|nr:hypothetical protein FOCC_FOCC001216 [Frankliniella occidentalis]